MISLKDLTIENLPKLEPRLEALINEKLREIANDLISRPTEKKARKLTLQFDFIPKAKVDPGDTREVVCEAAYMAMQAKSSLPTYRTRDFEMRCARRGFQFNPDSPDSVNQTTLDYGDGGGPDDE
ncbi:MAG: hypothetical protein NT069_32455 [Planctomycetota bacterium]|nr:hypothetical protein [Planctomycetota bacterium]